VIPVGYHLRIAMTLRLTDEEARSLRLQAEAENRSMQDYPTVHGKAAAALLHSLARNHALVDGNKRMAWLATAVFLHLNGYEVAATDDELFDLVMAVADESVPDVEKIAERLAAATSAR
jgi:death-on-curing family protein